MNAKCWFYCFSVFLFKDWLVPLRRSVARSEQKAAPKRSGISAATLRDWNKKLRRSVGKSPPKRYLYSPSGWRRNWRIALSHSSTEGILLLSEQIKVRAHFVKTSHGAFGEGVLFKHRWYPGQMQERNRITTPHLPNSGISIQEPSV